PVQVVDATTQWTFDAGVATFVRFDNAAVTVLAGACSPAIELSPHDVFGNVTSFPQQTSLPLFATPSNGVSFFADGSCTTFFTTSEFANGVTVQHIKAGCVAQVTDVPITPVSDVNSTFLLFSHHQNGITFSDDDFRTAELTSDSNVRFTQFSATCSMLHIEL